MAAAEARAVWQRTANRCFVQEDAKRAPKLACCPSSSSVKHVDVGPTSPSDGQDHLVVGFAHLSRNPSHCNLSPDSKWWLQVQPNYALQRGLMDEQVSSASTEKKGSSIVNGQGNDKVEESYEFVEMASVECEFSKCSSNEFSSDPGYSWLEGERSEPWWKMTDRDELASFVLQRSHDFMENCDLPHPRKSSFKRDSYDHTGSFDGDGILSSWKPQNVGFPNPSIHTRCNVVSSKNWASVGVSSQCSVAVDKLISEGETCKSVGEMPTSSEVDSSKAKLLEALLHSQTRAREAEQAAREANAEKEHILKLFFKQASHLFAYKQWFYLLQLENLYYQLKSNKNQPISSLFPIATPHKTRKIRKTWHKKRAKQALPRHEHDLSKYAVVFALGLSLVGAGLLLGWTVGWMFPAL